ncbi:MAG: hypothetical protein AB7O89_01860 [Parachlamydiales bacterium]|nr:hypothetical protein [Verrucomicrobiota bacterium]
MSSTTPTARSSREFSFDHLLEMFQHLDSGETKPAETEYLEQETVSFTEQRLDSNTSSSSSLPISTPDDLSDPPIPISSSFPPLSATGKEIYPSPGFLRRPVQLSAPSLNSQPPPVPKRRTLPSISSDEIEHSPRDQNIDTRCNLLYQSNASCSYAPERSPSSSNPAPPPVLSLSLRLNLHLLSKDEKTDHRSRKDGGWKPLKISPGDISSRYRSSSSPEKRLDTKKTVSIRTLAREESTPSTSSSPSKKFSLGQITLTPRKKHNDQPLHHEETPATSSSSSDAPLTERGFEECAAELLGMPRRKHKFSDEKAALEIVNCLKRPGGMELVLNLFSQYHHLAKDKRLKDRWAQLLTTTLLYPQCLPLILAIIKKESIHPDDFSQLVIPEFHHKRISAVEATYILSLYTLEDLKGQDPKTLFRNVHLSSSLHKEYGIVLIERFVKQMKKEVIAYWKKTASPLDLCINDKKIHQILLENQQGYEQLAPERQLEIRTAALCKNIETCKNFFCCLLEKLYAEPVPAPCQDLLSMRRSQIFTAIKETLSEEEAFIQSEVLVGEILFLRILNPSLLQLGKLPIEVDALINLTKMLQAMSNQVKFGTEKRDEVFESFNDIYDRFSGMHHEFINRNFPLRSS